MLTNQNEDNKSTTDVVIRLVRELLGSTGTLAVLFYNLIFLIKMSSKLVSTAKQLSTG